MTEDRGCPDGCSYTKDDSDDSETWCFKEGPYQKDHTCWETASSESMSSALVSSVPSLVSTSTASTSIAATSSSVPRSDIQKSTAMASEVTTATGTSTKPTSPMITTELPPNTPSPSTRIKIQYEEDGEVFEQEDTYNNVTGEAKIVVPAHGNNSAVEVIMQESTVSKTINLAKEITGLFIGNFSDSWGPQL